MTYRIREHESSTGRVFSVEERRTWYCFPYWICVVSYLPTRAAAEAWIAQHGDQQ